jgi:hypothetical protein
VLQEEPAIFMASGVNRTYRLDNRNLRRQADPKPADESQKAWGFELSHWFWNTLL